MPPCMGLGRSPNTVNYPSPPTVPQYSYAENAYGFSKGFELPYFADNNTVDNGIVEWPPTDFVSDIGLDYSATNQYAGQISSPLSNGYNSGVISSCDTSPLPSWSSIQNSPPRSAGPTSPLSGQQQLCRVCNDIATGNHFGVMSCEACKSFFRRSIRAAARYVCRGSKCCEIDKNTRNRCQHCRLQKCFEVGMNKNAVQEERMPYPVKSRGKLSSERSSSPTQQQSTPTTPGSVTSTTTGVPGMPFPFYALGPTPIHMVNSSFTTDTKTQALSASVMLDILVKAEKAENEPKKVFQSPQNPLSYGKIQENARQSLTNVIAWAKEIPMFTRLSVEDQIKLIKRSWNELITLKLIYRNVKFPTGRGIAFSTGEVAQMYQSDDPMVVSFLQKVTKECIATMQDIQLDETELSCLKLISLMNPFIHSLTPSGLKEIEHTQDTCLELLEIHIKQSKPSSPRRMAKLLLFLGQVKALSKDIIAHIEAQQTLGFENDAVLLELISDTD